MRFEAIDGSPVPRKLAPAVRRIKAASGQTLNSCYRGTDTGAAGILRRFGKATQAALWYGWSHRLPGYNPANPPGYSTHELFNDGVAYAGWRGMPLRYWQVGQDWGPNSQKVIAAAAREGFTVTRTYPGSAREYHHLNMRKKPRLPFRVLRLGSRGRRVKTLHVYLRRLGYLPASHKATRHFGSTLRAALKRFQADHHQKADGILGPQSWRQLKASIRWHAKHGG